jgi:hypothetical protein
MQTSEWRELTAALDVNFKRSEKPALTSRRATTWFGDSASNTATTF